MSYCVFSEEEKRDLGAFSHHRKELKQRAEILAPTTSENFRHAVFCGADAIYFGYKEWSARATASGVTDLKEITDFCHLYGVKAYLALNIMLKSSELDAARDIIKEGEQAGIDAFIISDFSLIPMILRHSSAQIHISTQAGVHNRLGAQLAKELGASRVILSREITTDDIKDIVENVPIAVEVFAQGALCVGFSGACLISGMLTGNSGNRGRCMQLCRQKYESSLDGKKLSEGYLLSAKDICMLPRLQELSELGVASFKIEGRLRRSEYVAGATKIYKNALTRESYTKEDIDCLKILFNRGEYTEGYLNGSDEIIYPAVQNHIGCLAGTVVKAYQNQKFLLKSFRLIQKGDGFKLLRNGKEIGGAVATGELEGEFFYILTSKTEVKYGDSAHITSDSAYSQSVLSQTRKLNAEIAVRMVADEPIRIMAKSGQTIIEFEDELCERASSRYLTELDVIRQFSKAGNTEFNVTEVISRLGNAFVGVGKLNELRRRALSELKEAILSTYQRPTLERKRLQFPKTESITGDFGEFSSEKQLTETVISKLKNIVYSPLRYTVSEATSFCKTLKDFGSTHLIFLKLPIFLPTDSLLFFEQLCLLFDGILANNLAGIQLARSLDKKLVLGPSLNIANSKNLLLSFANQYVISAELSKSELRTLKGGLLYSYGNLPLMHLVHCPRKLSGCICDNCAGDFRYHDNKGEYRLLSQRFLGHCTHELRNGHITYLPPMEGFFRYFDFSCSDTDTVEQVLQENLPDAGATVFNKLHLTRGVR